ncbi:hypothetical protein OA525_01295 [Alphaproteobacteria bacterium]|jgi:hypothetical protein|nr:hypothetical protein [Alphaproteobacteria bacterium]|tara:strand:+ start:59 stop:244 length:186 start_codon:yes stop_codon:yes gene_type:complete
MGLHFDYKSKAGERAMEKERKKKEKLAAKKAKREAKREEEELAELERLTNPNASPEDNQET